MLLNQRAHLIQLFIIKANEAYAKSQARMVRYHAGHFKGFLITAENV